MHRPHPLALAAAAVLATACGAPAARAPAAQPSVTPPPAAATPSAPGDAGDARRGDAAPPLPPGNVAVLGPTELQGGLGADPTTHPELFRGGQRARPTPGPRPSTPPLDLGRLRDGAGPVAGLPGVRLSHVPDANACGGVRIEVEMRRAKIAPADRPLAGLLELAAPRDPATGTTSLDAMKPWLEEVVRRLKTAEADLGPRAETGTPAERAAGSARLAQARLRTASLLARGPIPAPLRAGDRGDEAVAVFCEALADKARSLIERGEAALAACAPAAATGRPAWWVPLCTP